MYYELLNGVHIEGGKTYCVHVSKSPQGETIKECPMVESNRDLVKMFGTNKFRRLSAEEVKIRLAEAGTSEASDEVSDVSPVAQAAQRGAKDLEPNDDVDDDDDVD